MHSKASGSLVGRIAHELAGRIIRGELVASQRIRETKVAELLGVGRGTVREALLILQRRHLVEIRPNCGARVASLSADKVRAVRAVDSFIPFAGAGNGAKLGAA